MKKRLWVLVVFVSILITISILVLAFNKPKTVLLSFDVEAVDKPSTLVLITHVLEKNNVKATFFVTGQFAERNPEFIKYLDKNNHEVACHTYSHAIMTRLSDEDKEENIARCISSISKILGKDPVGFRAPNHEIDSSTFKLLYEFGFGYDSSLIEGYSFFAPKPTIPEIKLSSILFLPIEDYLYINTIKSPSIFFNLAKLYRGNQISILVHPRYISGHIDEFGDLIEHYKGTNAEFITFMEFLASKN